VQYNLKREGHEAMIASDGNAALHLFTDTPPDLVILDLMLPGMDGLAICRRMRQTSSVPILMLTAKAEELDKLVGLEMGADDYMTKPFSMRELLARVRALLRRVDMDRTTQTTSATTPVSEINGLLVDTARHEVRLDGAPVDLSPKEFELLTFLAANRGLVFTRDALLERVWGYNYSGETRTVDVHIRGLREKLGDDANTPRFIETVRRVGYRFR
jgi:two-component system, OmpR family, alkaline phosphatase synthesis response regulator PhoP